MQLIVSVCAPDGNLSQNNAKQTFLLKQNGTKRLHYSVTYRIRMQVVTCQQLIL